MSYPQPQRRVYLLAYRGFRPVITRYLDTRREVLNWYALLPNAILILANVDVHTLTAVLRAGVPAVWFILTEVDPYRTNGFMNQEVWNFINRPWSSGRWEP